MTITSLRYYLQYKHILQNIWIKGQITVGVNTGNERKNEHG